MNDRTEREEQLTGELMTKLMREQPAQFTTTFSDKGISIEYQDTVWRVKNVSTQAVAAQAEQRVRAADVHAFLGQVAGMVRQSFGMMKARAMHNDASFWAINPFYNPYCLEDLAALHNTLSSVEEQLVSQVTLMQRPEPKAIPSSARLYLVGDSGKDRFLYTLGKSTFGRKNRQQLMRFDHSLDEIATGLGANAIYSVERMPYDILPTERDVNSLLLSQYARVKKLVHDGRLSHYPVGEIRSLENSL